MSRIVPKRGILSGVCVLAVAVVIAACGSSSKPASTATTPTTGASTATSQPTGTTIKVGMICTCSGAGGFGAADLPAKNVYQAWVDSVNASGGIAGHPVELIAEDDTGNPGTAVTDAQTLISDHVVAIADVSLTDQAFATAVAAANIPVVGIETPNTPFGTNPDFYPEAQTNDSAIQAVFATAKAAGATNLANVYCAESPVCAQSVPYFTAVGKAVGIPVAYNAEVSATAPNYTAQCLAAQQAGVKSIFIGDSSTVIAKIASDCSVQNYNPVYITEGAGFALSEATATGLKNDLWNEFPATPFFATTPVVEQANAAIDKYFPGQRTNILFNQIDFMAWASGQLLADAITGGGLTATVTPTAAEVVQGLDSLKGDTLQGLTVPLTFTAGQPHHVDCWFTTRVQAGIPSLQNNGQDTCAAASS